MSRPAGPTRGTVLLVDARDGYRCVRCGRSLGSVPGSRHHRQLRRHGDHSPSNLVLLCGSGTTGCHGWVHSEPALARALGLMVRGTNQPADVPVYVGFLRQWALLDRNGTMRTLPQDQALAALEAQGQR